MPQGRFHRELPSRWRTSGEWFALGQQQFQRRVYSAALKSFDCAISLQPNWIDAWRCRAETLTKLRRYQEAKAACDRITWLHSPDITDESGKQWFEQGNHHAMSGEFAAAADWYDRVINLQANQCIVWANRGAVLAELGRYKAALESLDNALEIDSTLDLVWIKRGVVLVNLKRYDAALESYDQAIQIQPCNYEVWLNRGEALMNLGRYQEALADCNRSLKSQLSHNAFCVRGETRRRLCQYESAIADFDDALNINPAFYIAWHNRGLALSNLEENETALDNFEKALSLGQNDSAVWHNCGHILKKLNRYEAALNHYDSALSLDPNYVGALLERGLVLGELKRHQDAILSYERLLEFQPDHCEALSNRGAELNNLEQYELALESANRAIEIEPRASHAWYVKGYALDGLGFCSEAIDSCDKAIAIKQDNHFAWRCRGDALGKLGNHQKAIESYERALQYKPDCYMSWSQRGVALHELGHYKEALESYDQALHYKSDFHDAWHGRGNVLHKLCQYEESISNCDQALFCKPDAHITWHNRGLTAEDSDGREKSPFAFSLPPEMYSPELEKRGHEGRLASIRQGFKYIERGTEGWGLLHSYLGNAYRDRARRIELPYRFWRKASSSYKTALKTLTPDRFPESHLDVLRNLIGVLFALNEIDEAQTLQRDGSDLLRRLLSDPTCSPKQQQSLLSKQSSFDQISVDLAVQAGDSAAALQLAEHGKNTCLRWMLEIDEPPRITYTDVQQWLPSTTALVYWHLSPNALTTFVILPGHDRPLSISAPILLLTNCTSEPQTDQTDERPDTVKQLLAWETWLDEWNQDYQSYSSEKNLQHSHSWRTRMSDRLDTLQQILNISAIQDCLPPSVTQLVLVPHRDLHRFPVHTFFHLPSTYLPSIYLGLSTLSSNNNCDRLLLIENPKTDAVSGGGAFIEIESALIQQLFPTHLIEKDDATAQQVTDALNQPHRMLHFSGHGAYDSHNPAQSCLFLAGNDRLTLQTLAHLDLSAYDLICLAACETGITGRQTITDEYVGLPSAFLKAKATHIVSTFWRVDSAASVYFIIEFYRELAAGQSPYLALQHAQTFLKSATRQDLIAWIDAAPSDLPKSYRITLREEREFLAESEIDHPYAHPYYWSSFSIAGL